MRHGFLAEEQCLWQFMENKRIVLESAYSCSDSRARARLHSCLGDLSNYDVRAELSWEKTLQTPLFLHNSSSPLYLPHVVLRSSYAISATDYPTHQHTPQPHTFTLSRNPVPPSSSSKAAVEGPGRTCFHLAVCNYYFFREIIIFFIIIVPNIFQGQLYGERQRDGIKSLPQRQF